MTRVVRVGSLEIGPGRSLCLIAGPCVIESRDHCLQMAERIRAAAAGLPFIFKASFDKANRTSIDSYRGPGLHRGLEILQIVREQAGVPVLTDIHEPEQARLAAQVVDVLQIPAYLCRQTDLLIAAGETGKPVNIKKGQFLAPEDMRHVVDKVISTGNRDILVTERGTCFGYHNLVVDMRSLVEMRACGCPVVFDATHSVQLPGGGSGRSSGQREFVAPLARAAAAVGIDALFVETHDNPDRAPSDGPNMVPLADLPDLLSAVRSVHRAVAEGTEPETDHEA